MSRLLSLTAGLVAAAGVLVATLPTAEAGPAGSSRDCFRLSNIQNTKMEGDRTLFLRSSTGAFYRMDFGADCDNISSEPLILHPVDNSDEVCSAIGLDVRVRGAGACIPTSLRRLTPDEVAAIPPRDRP
jgi:hypothetical protein